MQVADIGLLIPRAPDINKTYIFKNILLFINFTIIKI